MPIRLFSKKSIPADAGFASYRLLTVVLAVLMAGHS